MCAYAKGYVFFMKPNSVCMRNMWQMSQIGNKCLIDFQRVGLIEIFCYMAYKYWCWSLSLVCILAVIVMCIIIVWLSYIWFAISDLLLHNDYSWGFNQHLCCGFVWLCIFTARFIKFHQLVHYTLASVHQFFFFWSIHRQTCLLARRGWLKR